MTWWDLHGLQTYRVSPFRKGQFWNTWCLQPWLISFETGVEVGGLIACKCWRKKLKRVSTPCCTLLGAADQVIFWYHLLPQMTIILGHSLQVKALGPKKECPYDVHRRFVICNLTRCTLRLYPGKNLQKRCSNPGSSAKDPLHRKPVRRVGCLAPSVLVTMETRDMFPSDACWELFQKWRNPCPNHPCLMLN